MITDERAINKVFVTTVACVILFLISSHLAYAQRGYLAVGGEYVFFLIPPFTLWYEWMKGGK